MYICAEDLAAGMPVAFVFYSLVSVGDVCGPLAPKCLLLLQDNGAPILISFNDAMLISPTRVGVADANDVVDCESLQPFWQDDGAWAERASRVGWRGGA